MKRTFASEDSWGVRADPPRGLKLKVASGVRKIAGGFNSPNPTGNSDTGLNRTGELLLFNN